MEISYFLETVTTIINNNTYDDDTNLQTLVIDTICISLMLLIIILALQVCICTTNS
jgi:hypothetical protein